MATYNVVELQPTPALGNITDATCINANSVVGGLVGNDLEQVEVTGQLGWVATIWADPASPQSYFFAPNSWVTDLNDQGDAVGISMAENSVTASHQAFVIRGEAPVDLIPSMPGGSQATGIDNSGIVAGAFLGLVEVPVPSSGFRYDSVTRAAPTIIPPLPGQVDSASTAINQDGVMTGPSGSHAFLFVQGELTDLGVVDPAIDSPFVADINDRGFVVATKINASKNQQAAYCDTSQPAPLSFVEIPFPPGGFINSLATAINNNNDVVGACWPSSDAVQSAFICHVGDSVGTDLNTVIPQGLGWQLQFAEDINDRGQIVGKGLFNGQQRGFLLTPIVPFNPHQILNQILGLVGTILGGIAKDGDGIVFVNGVGHRIGPGGPGDPQGGDSAARADLLISQVLDELATQLGNTEGRGAIRRIVFEAARTQIDILLAEQESRGE